MTENFGSGNGAFHPKVAIRLSDLTMQIGRVARILVQIGRHFPHFLIDSAKMESRWRVKSKWNKYFKFKASSCLIDGAVGGSFLWVGHHICQRPYYAAGHW
jgi:hypothetical protein